jgi:hypothetical protein
LQRGTEAIWGGLSGLAATGSPIEPLDYA